MGFILRYARVFATQLKNNFVREAVYRTNFLMTLIVDVAWLGVELSLFAVIYANVPEIAGWRKEETYFFLGIFFASDALFTVFFQRNFWAFSDLVNHAELDILLTKPIHPLFLALTRWINISALLNFLTGLLVAAHYANAAGFDGGWRWLLLPAWLVVGCVTALLVRFLFSVWVFWTDRGWPLNMLYYQFFNLASKPDIIFPKAVRIIITTIIPFAFIGSFPARSLLHKMEPSEMLQVVVVLSIFATLDLVLWKKALRRYQSASS